MSDPMNKLDPCDETVREVVAEWVDGSADVPDDFADNVMEAWSSDANDEPVVAVPRRARRTVAVCGGLAAAAAILLALSLDESVFSETARVAPGSDGAWVIPAGCDVDRAIAAAVPVVPPARSRTVLEALRGEARGVLVARCAPCHLGTESGAQAEALDVFDAHAEQWWTSISTRQLGVVRDRVTAVPGATARERETVNAFVAAELADK